MPFEQFWAMLEIISWGRCGPLNGFSRASVRVVTSGGPKCLALFVGRVTNVLSAEGLRGLAGRIEVLARFLASIARVVGAILGEGQLALSGVIPGDVGYGVKLTESGVANINTESETS